MSGICGIVHFGGAPADAGELQRMAAAIAYRGPDGTRLELRGEAGFAQLLWANTPEARCERGPLVSWPEDWLLAADARLDNRDELIAALGASAIDALRAETAAGSAADHSTLTDSTVLTDSQLILAAYRRWGADCPARLAGDFAFAVYQPAERRLFLARDPQGVRQLVYSLRTDGDVQTLRFATGAAALLAACPEQRLNRELFQDMIAGVFERFPAQTPYRDILRLPPAHALSVTPGDARLAPHWEFGADRSAAAGLPEAELPEALAELLERIVRAQLRSAGGAAVASGGGLDSSVLAALAERIVAQGQASAPVAVVSRVFPATPGAGDDVYRAILQAGCPHLRFTTVDCDDQWVMKQRPEEACLPYEDLDMLIPERAALLHTLAALRADGSQALLYGLNGDQLFGQWLYSRPACLLDFPLRAWPAELPHFRAALGGSTPQVLAQAFARRLLGVQPRKRLWRIAGRLRPARLSKHAWALPARSPAAFLPPRRGLSAAAGVLYSLTVNASVYARLRAFDQIGAFMGVELRLPYLDRRLVDFMAALDGRCFGRDGVTRWLFRQAMQGRMPEAIRTRTSKEGFAFLLERGLDEREKQRIQALLRNPLIARLGLVDAAAYRAAWQSYWDGARRTYSPLLVAMSAELWLQRILEHGRLTADADGPDHDCRAMALMINIKGD